jgi:hypothetical protein
MKYTLTSVIPVVSYGNIQPSIEVEADTFEQAQALVEPEMIKLWDKYNPGVMRGGNRQLLKAFVGGEVYYDASTHTYTNETGEVYESGSQYANKFRQPFDKQKIAEAMASKTGGSAEDIIKMWELKSEVSKDFGNAIHKALQLYEQYRSLAESLNKTTYSHDHPVIKNAVQSFINAHKGERVISEALVVDNTNKKAGQIDRLVIIDETKKICRVDDFKTNAAIEKELPVYWKQLEFYMGILEADGWTTQPPKIHHYNGEWKTYAKV